jgi:light-regulated signal transduction histidine kinase (bacteriophytochrome)
MGVRASLSLPIMVGSELWGLIACHHSEPRVLPLKTLRAASQVARHYSMVVSTWVAETRMRFVDSLDSTCMALRAPMQQPGGVLSAMPEIAPNLFELFSASGLAIRLGKVWAHTGNSPNSSELDKLSDWLSASDSASLSLIDSLSRSVPQLGDVPVAGALALQSRTRDGQCLQLWLFRRELVEEVQWGGNPHKPIEIDDGKSGVAPRRSFDKWVEKRKGYSSPWTGENRLAAKRLRQLLLELYA